MIREGSGAERTGAVLCWATSCSTLRFVLSPTHPPNSREEGRLCLQQQKSVKNLVYIKDMHQVNYKREQIGPPHVLFPLFHSHCLSQLHATGPRWDLRTGDVLRPLTPFSCFLTLLCMGKPQLSHWLAGQNLSNLNSVVVAEFRHLYNKSIRAPWHVFWCSHSASPECEHHVPYKQVMTITILV